MVRGVIRVVMAREEKPKASAAMLVSGTAFFMLLMQNSALWGQVHTALNGASLAESAPLVLALFGGLWAALVAVIALLAIPFGVKPTLVTLLMVGGVCAYFMGDFGVVIDRDMLVNVLQTDFNESYELMGWPMTWHVLALGVMPAAVVLWIDYQPGGFLKKSLGLLSLSAVAVLVSGLVILSQYKTISFWTRKNSDLKHYINPVYPVSSLYKLAKGAALDSSSPEIAITIPDARRTVPVVQDRPLVVFLVVGETARASNFSLNGYDRTTNPKLSEVANLVNFSDVSACGTATAVSLPCMFSHLGRKDYSDRLAKRQENILDVVRRTGVNVHWDDNNSGCKGVCARVDTEQFEMSGFDAVDGPERGFDDRLIARAREHLDEGVRGDSLYVLHQSGSHGPAYFRRYPSDFAKFQPECRRDDVQSCSRDEVVNAYDNSILYTDFNLSQLIDVLKAKESDFDSVMLYVSDHGESLGERGLYLHGLPRSLAPEAQTKVPMMAWMSPGAWDRLNLTMACMSAVRQRAYSHDNLFDTLMGIFSIQSNSYHPGDDVFGACRDIRTGAIHTPLA